MTSYVLTVDAEHDIADIKTYLVGRGGPSAARHVLTRIEAALRFLGTRPDAGHIRRDLTCDPVKFWPVFSYLIIYDAVPKPIHVVRVLHASRNIETLLSD